jgi:hypothetical protein
MGLDGKPQPPNCCDVNRQYGMDICRWDCVLFPANVSDEYVASFWAYIEEDYGAIIGYTEFVDAMTEWGGEFVDCIDEIYGCKLDSVNDAVNPFDTGYPDYDYRYPDCLGRHPLYLFNCDEFEYVGWGFGKNWTAIEKSQWEEIELNALHCGQPLVPNQAKLADFGGVSTTDYGLPEATFALYTWDANSMTTLRANERLEVGEKIYVKELCMEGAPSGRFLEQWYRTKEDCLSDSVVPYAIDTAGARYYADEAWLCYGWPEEERRKLHDKLNKEDAKMDTAELDKARMRRRERRRMNPANVGGAGSHVHHLKHQSGKRLFDLPDKFRKQ